MPGADISRVELTNVSSHCLWLMIDDEEFALLVGATRQALDAACG